MTNPVGRPERLVRGLVMLATFAVAAPASWLVAAVESQLLRWPPLAGLTRGLAAGWLIVAMRGWAGVFLGLPVRGTFLAIGPGPVRTLAAGNLVRGFASLLAAIEVLQRWLPRTGAGSVAAAAGVPVPGARGGTLGVTTTADGPPGDAGARRLPGGLHGGRGGAAPAARHHPTLKERRTAMNAHSTWPGPRAATVAGLVAGAAGIAILWASGVEFPIYPPPGIIILLAGAIFVGLASWPWAPAVGAVLGLFITVGFVASGGPANLFGQDGTGVAIGTWIQMAGVLTALAAGVIATRASYREQAQARQ